MTDRLPRSLFTTEHLKDVTEKILAWRESTSFIFDVQPLHDPYLHGFHARIESFNFGSVVTSLCSSVPADWRRSFNDTASNGLDHILIQFYISGHGYIVDGENETRIDPGEIYILDAAQQIHARTAHFRNLTLWVARGLLAGRLKNIHSVHGRVLSANNPLATILRQHLLQLHEGAAQMTVTQGERMVAPTIDLLVSALNTGEHRNVISPSAAATTLLIALKQYVHDHLDSPDLGVRSITKALQVSRSALYRNCEPLGGITQYIRQQRMRKALRALGDPDLRHLAVSQIASYWGFEDASTFNRLFRREFGISPREARRLPFNPVAARQQSSMTGEAQPAGDDQCQTWFAGLSH